MSTPRICPTPRRRFFGVLVVVDIDAKFGNRKHTYSRHDTVLKTTTRIKKEMFVHVSANVKL